MKKLKKKITGRIESKSNPGQFHIQYSDGTCTCIGFRIHKSCTHTNSKGASMKNAKSVKLAAKGKTTRATMINLLLKNKGKVVSIDSIASAVIKVKKLKSESSDAKLQAKIVKRAVEVGKWFASHKLKLVKSGKGFKAA